VSGATARKAIDNIRKQNAESGDKAYKPSPVNAERGKLTDKITPSGNLLAQSAFPLGISVGTNKLASNDIALAVALQSNETTVLEETMYYGETAVLVNEPISIEDELTFIHTNEVIE